MLSSNLNNTETKTSLSPDTNKMVDQDQERTAAVGQRDDANELSQETGASPLGEYYITPGMPELLRQSAAEGLVLLKNDGVLPLDPAKVVSVFGRCQHDYFYVGYGSGGDVNPPYTVNLMEGLQNSGRVLLNEKLAEVYRRWSARSENKPAEGYWGNWPMNYAEMPLTGDLVTEAAVDSQVALVVIGRAAGEDRESILEKGSYYLTDDETKMLDFVTEKFGDVVVLLDCGNIIDVSWIAGYGDRISAVVYAWQGGMEAGNGLADVLTGAVNFSGRLSDSIARHYEDYPGSRSFGDQLFNNYLEDIYVGYRYFETFAPEKVLYPFGFGLSYTTFKFELLNFEHVGARTVAAIRVTNSGTVPGKATPQLYVSAPQAKLGKPAKSLVSFGKTKVLDPGTSEDFEFAMSDYELSSYDDLGKSGHPSAYVLEAGLYTFHLGENVAAAQPVASFNQAKTIVVRQLESVLALQEEFGRMVPGDLGEAHFELNWESLPAGKVNLKERILARLPEALRVAAGDGQIQFDEVLADPSKLDAFIQQLDQAELEALTRGQGGMNSDLGTSGNAGAYGGIIESLREKGVKPIITTDGPAGIRLQRYCSLLPCGTALACTWNTELVLAVHDKLGEEMLHYGSDVLLSPGMNIHRSPLCGRNFEYFSEDPLLTGKMASAVVLGVQKHGVAACPKHFAMNNQETNRNFHDARVSERAAREIYLKGFEIVVQDSKPDVIMTSYNKINGVWAHYNYDLATTVLRGEWGFRGMIVTDWWMRQDKSHEFPKMRDNAYRVRAQVDVLMPGGSKFEEVEYKSDGTLLETLGEEDGLTLGELQRTARNVLRHIIKRHAK